MREREVKSEGVPQWQPKEGVESAALRAASQPNAPRFDADVVFPDWRPSYAREAHSHFATNFSVAVDRAAKARDELAVSYRGFNVGAAGYSYDPETKALHLVTGANIKFDNSDVVNIHAEDVMLQKAQKAGVSYLSGIVVFGTPQADHGSGIVSPTLHPCERCRESLAASGLVDEDTLIMTVSDDYRNVELFSLPTLLALHENDPARMPTVHHIVDPHGNEIASRVNAIDFARDIVHFGTKLEVEDPFEQLCQAGLAVAIAHRFMVRDQG